jgi:hypothetical protein
MSKVGFSHWTRFYDYSNTNKESIFSRFSRFKTMDCNPIVILILAACRNRRWTQEKEKNNESCPCLLSIGVKSMMLSSWKIDEKLTQLLKHLGLHQI